MNVSSTFNSPAMVAYGAAAQAKAKTSATEQAAKDAKTDDAVSLSKNPPTTAARSATTRRTFPCARA